ncbi:glycosyltransferase [Providencia sp. PROV118]|uniref:glycosyltransferase n=1 Tax=Providencia sp. PROV118 TaxID=2949829 RepID=UPI00234905E9|nr:glycosyltransferase [Providencia sp. PROV118]
MAKKSFAVLLCVYDGDSSSNFSDMLHSLLKSEIPDGYEMRIYLHVDGYICDKKEKIIESHKIFKIIRTSKNIGLSKGLNKLIDAKEDELYFFRMDSDDLQIEDRFIKQISFMNENPIIDFSGGAITEFEGQPKNIIYRREYPKDSYAIKQHLVKGSPFAHVTMCFRSDFFIKFGKYPTDFPLNEDIAYWFKAIKLGAVGANITDTLINVRMDSAYSRRTLIKAISEFKVYYSICKWQKRGFFYPIMRFSFRLLPASLVKKMYNSKLRNKLLV